MSDMTTDQQLRRTMKAIVDTAPDAPDVLEPPLVPARPRRRASNVLVAAAAFVTVLLVGGLSMLLVGGTPESDVAGFGDSSNEVASDGDVQLTSDFAVPVFDGPVDTEGAMVYQAEPGPAIAGIETDQLGTEVVIEANRPDLLVVPVSDNPINALQADRIVYLGDLEGAQLALHAFNGKTCVYLGNGTEVTGGGGCVTEDGLAGGNDYVDPPVGSWLAWTQLPQSASVVVGETADGARYWQRVVGRTVVFILSDETTLEPNSLSALDANGNEVATTQGRELDLAEIGFWDPSVVECPPDGPDGPVPDGC